MGLSIPNPITSAISAVGGFIVNTGKSVGDDACNMVNGENFVKAQQHNALNSYATMELHRGLEIAGAGVAMILVGRHLNKSAGVESSLATWLTRGGVVGAVYGGTLVVNRSVAESYAKANY